MDDTEKTKRRSANENPWYWLATLYGEPLQSDNWAYLDRELAKRNRIAWNRWMGGALSDEQRTDLIEKGLFAPEVFLVGDKDSEIVGIETDRRAEELMPFSDEEREELLHAFTARAGKETPELPSPSEDIDFTETEFAFPAVFEKYLFAKNVIFRSATFPGGTSFNSATFGGEADFSSTTFAGWSNFDSARFLEAAEFRSVSFLEDTGFSAANFRKHADFSRARFSEGAGFSEATFSKGTSFDQATFSGSADFSGTTFWASALITAASFRSSTFSESANFCDATFSETIVYGLPLPGEVDFSDATFHKHVDFKNARFSGAADFRAARFGGEASFGSARFQGNVDFRAAAFSDKADFQWVRLSGSVLFLDAELNARTVFANAVFERAVPDFRGAKMHEATEFHGVKWPKLRPPMRFYGLQIPGQPEDKDSVQAWVYAYERLRQEMERLEKHADERFFFRQELRARRVLSPKWSWETLFNWAYEKTSAYGESVAKPLAWLGALSVVGGVLFAAAALFDGKPLDPTLLIKKSLASIFSFLPVARDVLSNLSLIEFFVSAAESLFSIALFFLLGLALRNRFRMR